MTDSGIVAARQRSRRPTQVSTPARRTSARHPSRAVLTVLCVLISLGFAAPFVWIGITALRPSSEALRYTSPFQLRTLVPETFTVDNVVSLFTGPFLRAIVNSVVISSASVILGLLLSAAAAYVFATVRFRGRGVLFAVVVFSFMIPFEVLAVPLSAAVRDLGLTDSYIALILPGVGNGLAVFLLRQFFLGVPGELSEAAAIDGASWASIFWRIYLPLSRPAMIAAGLMIFLFQWQAYLWPLLVTTDGNLDVAPVALARAFGQSYDADYGLIFAGSALLTLIPAVLLLWFQRYFVESAARTGLRG